MEPGKSSRSVTPTNGESFLFCRVIVTVEMPLAATVLGEKALFTGQVGNNLHGQIVAQVVGRRSVLIVCYVCGRNHVGDGSWGRAGHPNFDPALNTCFYSSVHQGDAGSACYGCKRSIWATSGGHVWTVRITDRHAGWERIGQSEVCKRRISWRPHVDAQARVVPRIDRIRAKRFVCHDPGASCINVTRAEAGRILVTPGWLALNAPAGMVLV